MPDYALDLPGRFDPARRTVAPSSAPTSKASVQDTSWEARFGRVLLQSGLAVVPKALFSHQGALGLTAQEVWFVARVLAHTRDSALPNPSLKAIAAEAGMSVQGVRRIRDQLLERDMLAVRAEFDAFSGVQLASAYDFSALFAALEQALQDDPGSPDLIEEDDLAVSAVAAAQYDNTFVARFGRVVARAGVSPIPTALFTYQASLGLSAPELWFVLQILSYKWTAALPYPSLKKLATRTGYTDRNLHKIKDTLVERGYLAIIARELPHGGRASNAYDFSGLFDKLINLLPTSQTPAAINTPTQITAPSRRRGRARRPNDPLVSAVDAEPQTYPATAEQVGSNLPKLAAAAPTQAESGSAESSSSDSAFSRGNNSSYARGNNSSYTRGNSSSYTRDNNSSVSRVHNSSVGVSDGSQEAQQQFIWGSTAVHIPDNSGSHQGQDKFPVETTAVHRGGASVVPIRVSSSSVGRSNSSSVARGNGSSYEEGSLQEDHFEEKDSNHYAPMEQALERVSEALYSPYIAGVMDDLSRELADNSNRAPNVSQAMRLWRESGLGEENFVALLREARRLLREYQGKQGGSIIAKKGAYFFRVVEDMLNVRVEQPEGTAQPIASSPAPDQSETLAGEQSKALHQGAFGTARHNKKFATKRTGLA